jgi:uncharacterized protein
MTDIRLKLLIASFVLFAPLSASAAKKCPKLKGKPLVYAIGSSTLGSHLGGILARDLKKAGFKFRKWARASSGLARPDFHDWLSKIPDIAAEWKPAAFVISLGTNDYQALRFKSGKWIGHENAKKWKKIYAIRVDQMLRRASGRNRKRVVVWIGPTPFAGKRARKLSRVINDIIMSRIQAFDGPAFFVDVYGKIVAKNGEIRSTIPMGGKDRKVYSRDRVHTTRDLIRFIQVPPVIAALKNCKDQK